MKRIFACLLALSMLLACLSVTAETATPAEATPATPSEAAEEGILMHGYISPYAGYYVGVPAEWALIGAGSHQENLDQAYELLPDMDVSGLRRKMTAENDVLIAASKDGASMVLNYGKADGASNEDLIDSLDAFKKALTAQCPGIKFSDDCGKYEFNSLANLLYIGASYNGYEIRQYYMVAGENMYIFTFTGVTKQIAEVVLSTFRMQSTSDSGK
mgnify:FL=1